MVEIISVIWNVLQQCFPILPTLGQPSRETPPPTKAGHSPSVNLFQEDID
jgi:hypothetical protein